MFRMNNIESWMSRDAVIGKDVIGKDVPDNSPRLVRVGHHSLASVSPLALAVSSQIMSFYAARYGSTCILCPQAQ